MLGKNTPFYKLKQDNYIKIQCATEKKIKSIKLADRKKFSFERADAVFTSKFDDLNLKVEYFLLF